MKEIDVIRKKLPEARVLLCHFHVIKWLHNVNRNSKKFGTYDESVLTQMKHTITNMTYARTIEDYCLHRDEFKSLACRDDRTELWAYFEKNWDADAVMWVMAHLVDLPHFSNHTNNRVESLFRKLKRKLNGHHTMRASLAILLEFQRSNEEGYRSKIDMPGTLRDVSYSEEMNVVLGMTTRWVAAAIKTQYDVAVDKSLAERYAFKDNGATITVRRGDHEYQLEKEDWTCDCEFSQTMKLPCRHARTYKKSCGHPFMVPFAAIAPRWFGQSHLQLPQLCEVADPFVANIFKAKRSTATRASRLSEAEKYRRAQQALVRIGGELARLPDDQFESALGEMETRWYNLRQGHITDEETAQNGPHTSDKSDDDTGSASVINDPPDTTSMHNRSENESKEEGNDESDDEPVTQVAESGTQMTTTDCNTASTPPLVKLSGNVRRVGRPKLNRSAMKEKTRVALKEYNQGMKLRALLRESDVSDVAASLQEIMPPVRGVGSYLATYQVKTRSKTIVIKWSVDIEYVPDIVRFRLEESVIDDARDQLKQGLASEEHIELNSDGEEMDDAACYVVAIEKVGRFTREQLEAMKFLWNLQAACREAVLCCSWLTRSVKADVDDPVQSQTTFVNLLECWPYAALNGFGFDLTYNDLFRFRDSSWLNDNALRAFTVFLAKYKNNITVMLPPTDEESELGDKTLRTIVRGVEVQDFVLLPVNIGGVHWSGIVIDRAAKQINAAPSDVSAKGLTKLR